MQLKSVIETNLLLSQKQAKIQAITARILQTQEEQLKQTLRSQAFVSKSRPQNSSDLHRKLTEETQTDPVISFSSGQKPSPKRNQCGVVAGGFMSKTMGGEKLTLLLMPHAGNEKKAGKDEFVGERGEKIRVEGHEGVTASCKSRIAIISKYFCG